MVRQKNFKAVIYRGHKIVFRVEGEEVRAYDKSLIIDKDGIFIGKGKDKASAMLQVRKAVTAYKKATDIA